MTFTDTTGGIFGSVQQSDQNVIRGTLYQYSFSNKAPLVGLWGTFNEQNITSIGVITNDPTCDQNQISYVDEQVQTSPQAKPLTVPNEITNTPIVPEV